jgi:hypothetical protein
MDDKARDDKEQGQEEPAPAEPEWTPLPSRRRLRGGGLFGAIPVEEPDDAEPDDNEQR